MTTREYKIRWREKQDKAGKCHSCGRIKEQPALSLCDTCLADLRQAALVRYRTARGIPLDAPLSNRGRPRGPRK